MGSLGGLSRISHQAASSARSGVQGSKYESDAEPGDGFASKRDSRGLLGVMMASSLGRGKKKKLIKK